MCTQESYSPGVPNSFNQTEYFIFGVNHGVCRCISWMRACGNYELLTQPLSALHGNKYYVCQDHFLRTDYTHSRGLGPQSVPSVFQHHQPLLKVAIEDYCIRNNVDIPLDLADDVDQQVELGPVDHDYCEYECLCPRIVHVY